MRVGRSPPDVEDCLQPPSPLSCREPIYPPQHLSVWVGPSPTQMYRASPKYPVKNTSKAQARVGGRGEAKEYFVLPLIRIVAICVCLEEELWHLGGTGGSGWFRWFNCRRSIVG